MSYIAKADRYTQMKYNRCGNSGLLLSAFSLGLWHNFGSVDNYENMVAMLTTAFDLGITHFDLANNYGPVPGSAEENFGKVLKAEFSSYRDEIIVSTKAGYKMWEGPYGDWGSRKYMLSSLDQSLKRIGLEYVDIFYSHRPDANTPLEETMGALATAIQQGKALYVGLSNYRADDAKKAIEILDSMGIHCLIHQPKYSMFERWVEGGLLDVLEDKGVGSIAFGPLAQGLLTNKYLHGIPADSRAANANRAFLKQSDITQERVAKVAKLNEIAIRRGQSLAQMSLAWVLRGGRVTTALIGASKPSQIVENVKTLENLEFSKEELDKIEGILA